MSQAYNARLSDSEMFLMTSSAEREDNVHERLLSVSEDDDEINLGGIPSLNLRSVTRHPTKSLNEKKSRYAAISVLIIGLLLILAVNIGVAMHLKRKDGGFNFFSTANATKPVTNSECTKKNLVTPVKCDRTFPWQQYKLPDTIHPELYKIFLQPNLADGTFTGKVDIILHIAAATPMIVLHSKALNLSEIAISRDQVKTSLTNVRYCKELDLVAIVLAREMLIDEKITLHVNFSGNMKKSLRGFYMSKYSLKSGEKFKLATTQFEPIDARKAFPCFDEPNLKAKFALSIVRPAGYNTISNMPVENTVDLSDGSKLDQFETTLKMSTYLVAYVVSKFKHISKEIVARNGNLNVSAYAVQDRIDTAVYALNFSSEVVLFYEKLFNIPYPLPKLDVVAIPDFEAGAMENWGIITYRETSVLLDDMSSSTTDKEDVSLVIAHEIAHQWFGNYVTMNWWNDLWLNEGFASFMEYFAVDKINPSWKYIAEFHRYHTDSAMSTDESEYTHPISVAVDSATRIESLFDNISYSKGACIIMMMSDYLGIDTFLSGVSNYLRKFAYQNTKNIDLIDAVSAEAKEKGQHIPDMLKSWTSQPGFPIVNVSLQSNMVLITQSRYTLHQSDGEIDKCGKDAKDLIWQIPISYNTDYDRSKQWYILDRKSSSFSLKNTPAWITLNIGRGGYYLVNYDKELLHNIITQLKNDYTVIPEEDREGLVFNALKVAKVGILSYDYVFDLMAYAAKEDAIGPVTYVGGFISGIASDLRMQFKMDALSKIQSYGHKLFESVYQRYGWPKLNETNSALSHSDIKLKVTVVSILCGLEYANCTSEARRRFQLWRDDDLRLNPDYKKIVYDTAIKFGSDKDWDFLWKIYTTDKTINAHEKSRLLRALCYTKSEKRVSVLLEESLKDDHVRMQDAVTVFLNLQSTQIGGMMTWAFLRSKWAELLINFPLGSNESRRLLKIFNIFNDDIDIAAAERFLADKNLTETQFAKRFLDKAKFRVRWIKRAIPQIEDWLNSNVHDNGDM